MPGASGPEDQAQPRGNPPDKRSRGAEGRMPVAKGGPVRRRPARYGSLSRLRQASSHGWRGKTCEARMLSPFAGTSATYEGNVAATKTV